MTEEERLTLRSETINKPRVEIQSLDPESRRAAFDEVELGYTAVMAVEEAARCLNCGVCSECRECIKACDVDAIDFDMKPEEVELDAGAILVAVGFQEFDAKKLGNYGYGRLPNVVTSLEFERMLNASGPTLGHVVRPSDGKTPKRIVFIQCVGARGEGGRYYCSRFCCMNAVKDSMLVRQHDPEVEDVTILYTDLRAFGKGFLRTTPSRFSWKTPWSTNSGVFPPIWWCCRSPRRRTRPLANSPRSWTSRQMCMASWRAWTRPFPRWRPRRTASSFAAARWVPR
jgi:hypothetical protein